MTIGPNFVFLCVPRTASVSISRHWLPHYGGVELSPAEYHRRDVPPEHAHKFTFSVVRNPYARVASYWRFMQSFEPEKRSCGNIPLEEFPDWLQYAWTEGDPAATQWWPQREFLLGHDEDDDYVIHPKTGELMEITIPSTRIDRILHFENLEAELRALPFVIEWYPLPHCNASSAMVYTERKPFLQACLTRKFVDGVNRYEAGAFVAWGYTKL